MEESMFGRMALRGLLGIIIGCGAYYGTTAWGGYDQSHASAFGIIAAALGVAMIAEVKRIR